MGGLRVLDLFCGIGGLSLGFDKAGFQVTGVDISEIAGNTFTLNMRDHDNENRFIRSDLSSEIINDGYEIIIGGPPCKPWSPLNINKRREIHRDYMLVSCFFRHVEYNRPSAFLMENVPLLRGDKIMERCINGLSNMYSIESRIVRYSDYGAPTSRHRLIVFGVRKDRGNAEMFFRELARYTRPARRVRDVIWKLRDRKMGEIPDHEWFKTRVIEKYRDKYRDGKYGWYVLDWDKPAPSFGNIMKTYILHPDARRVISVREALFIMGFPDHFRFPEHTGLGVRYQMVADAVSPVFSYAAARVIRKMLYDGG
jgi:DNA (cytosine-5)-methyltransferase 1